MVTGSVVSRWLPGLGDELRPFSRSNLIAGLTVTAYLVPQVMAYAIIAGLSPVTGLWAALVAILSTRSSARRAGSVSDRNRAWR